MSGVNELPLVPEEKLMKCVSNKMDNTYDIDIVLEEQSRAHDASADVDVTSCTISYDNGLVESECLGASDDSNSSSFGNTESSIEEGSGLTDTEVESQLRCTNTSALISVFNGYRGAFQQRNKRLTDHWRKFIRPLMWRCKLIELQWKEIKSQAQKYDKELAENEKMKQLTYERYMLEGFDAKTLPFSSQVQGKKVMQRKKRKRVEETVDVASYISQHNFFSYFEDKRLVADGPLDDNCGNIGKIIDGNDELGFNDGWSSLEFWNDHNSTEPTLRKIDEVRSRIGKLKTRIDKVLTEHPGKFCSINKLSSHAPCDASNSSDQNTASPRNGERVFVKYNSSHPMSDCRKEDRHMPESACSSHGEVNPLPNMLDFTDKPRDMGSYVDMEDEVLIHNQEGASCLHNFERMGSQLIKKPEAPKEEPLETLPVVVIPETGGKTSLLGVGGESLPISESDAPKTTRMFTRRRGGRKSGVGR